MIEEKRLISSHELFDMIEEQLAENRQVVFAVTGMSMWPFICHGRDQVVLTKCSVNSLKRGDIVLWKTPLGEYILHRVTQILPDYIETTGDGNCFRDGLIHKTYIKARVKTIIRKDKSIECDCFYWKMIFKIWMLVIPIRKVLLIILCDISKIRDKVRKAFL